MADIHSGGGGHGRFTVVGHPQRVASSYSQGVALKPFRFATSVLVVSVILSACCSSGPTAAHQVYGPSGHHFSVAFPSTPKSQSNTTGRLTGLLTGSKAYSYQVSPEADIFSSAALPVPRPPAYGVAVIVMQSPSVAKAFVNTLSLIPGVKRFAVSGLSGYKFIGPEKSAINDTSRVSDSGASEGVLFLLRGTTVYIVEVISAHLADAKAFLDSFRTA